MATPFDMVPDSECQCDVDYLCDAHAALLEQEAAYWVPRLAARITAIVEEEPDDDPDLTRARIEASS